MLKGSEVRLMEAKYRFESKEKDLLKWIRLTND